jgi:hypothetical protein
VGANGYTAVSEVGTNMVAGREPVVLRPAELAPCRRSALVMAASSTVGAPATTFDGTGACKGAVGLRVCKHQLKTTLSRVMSLNTSHELKKRRRKKSLFCHLSCLPFSPSLFTSPVSFLLSPFSFLLPPFSFP